MAMMSKEDAEQFCFKVDMEGLDYAIQNYCPKDTGDTKFEKLIDAAHKAIEDIEGYIEELREAYDIEVC